MSVGESCYNPSLNGQLHYPTDIDRPLNEAASDKIIVPKSRDKFSLQVCAQLEFETHVVLFQSRWRHIPCPSLGSSY
jgi:hypothetical protein